MIRLEFLQVVKNYIPAIIWMLAISFLIKPIVYKRFGLYQRFWIYASSREALIITMGASLAATLVGVVMLGLLGFQIIELFPRQKYLM